MNIIERIREREKRQEPSPIPKKAPVDNEQEYDIPLPGDKSTPGYIPVPAPVDTPTNVSVPLLNDLNKRYNNVNPVTSNLSVEMPDAAKDIPHDNRPEWAKLSYEELVKKNPNWSRGQYAYELAKWRRENGEPDLSYAEWANIIKGEDPYETEAERKKRERNHKLANSINAMGSFINALVNYNRVNRGHVGYTPDDGSQGYNRLRRLREAQRQTARINANAYLDAMSRDRAERAKAEAQAAAAATAQRNYDLKKAELQFKLNNAANEEARRNAAAELKKLEFEHKKDMDERRLKETERHNRQVETNGRIGKDKVATSVKSSDGRTFTRNTPLSLEEAMQIVYSNPDYAAELDKYRKTSTRTDDEGNLINTYGDIDWYSAASDILSNGGVNSSTLIDMGFKRGGNASIGPENNHSSAGLGWGSKTKAKNEIKW